MNPCKRHRRSRWDQKNRTVPVQTWYQYVPWLIQQQLQFVSTCILVTFCDHITCSAILYAEPTPCTKQKSYSTFPVKSTSIHFVSCYGFVILSASLVLQLCLLLSEDVPEVGSDSMRPGSHLHSHTAVRMRPYVAQTPSKYGLSYLISNVSRMH